MLDPRKTIALAAFTLIIIVVVFVVWQLLDRGESEQSTNVQVRQVQEQENRPRIVDQLPANDKDADGLPDEEERAVGSDPTKYDTDGDSLSDGDEVNRFATDPTKADTDGDGFLDAVEIMNGYDPLVP